MSRFIIEYDQQGIAYVENFDDALYDDEINFVDKIWGILDNTPYYLYSSREKRLIIAALLEGDMADYALTALEVSSLEEHYEY